MNMVDVVVLVVITGFEQDAFSINFVVSITVIVVTVVFIAYVLD